jgi:hypothetical protein
MRHHGWISKALLTYLEHTPIRRFLGGSANFHANAAKLLDERLFALWGVFLIALALIIWRLRTHIVKPRYEHRLWMSLIVLVFGGSALMYSLVSEPDTDTNFWSLAPYVAKLPAPVYTDRYTAFVLGYLSGYRDLNIRSTGYLPDSRVRPLLRRHQGCFLVSEPQLEREKGDNLAQGSPAIIFGVLHHPPPGWVIVKRVAATENPLESIIVLCARA